jgi:hypothetical protein
MTRLKAEMTTQPARPGNWEGFAPQRPEPYVHKESLERGRVTDPQALERKETPTGIPGLTYDQKGCPVYVLIPSRIG